MKGALVGLLLLGSGAFAQTPAPSPTPFDLGQYLTKHAYITSGTIRTDGENHTVFEVRFVDDFEIADQWRGAARVSLFTLARTGEQAPAPEIPTTLSQAKAYSDGEVWLAGYKIVNDWFAFECLGGVTFKMAAISGTVGNPLDGTKLALGCGPRLRYQGNHVSVVAGHFGPVVEGDKVLGPVPSIMVHAYVPLKFLGKNTAFTPDMAFGAAPPLAGDPDQRRQLRQSIRLLISAGF